MRFITGIVRGIVNFVFGATVGVIIGMAFEGLLVIFSGSFLDLAINTHKSINANGDAWDQSAIINYDD